MSVLDRNTELRREGTEASHRPIFIHGILGRSGTNYLAKLIALHPDCKLSLLPEDWCLSEVAHLDRYAEAVGKAWRRHRDWDIPADRERELLQHLGRGVLSFIAADGHGDGDGDGEGDGNGEARRIVSKTPDVQGLDRFFDLFPDGYLLILVRDGRSVVESATRSFGIRPEQIARWWAWAAARILEFDRMNRDRMNRDRMNRDRTNRGHELRYRVVRYEELTRDPRREVRELLRFLDLSTENYDFDALENLPIYGSSTETDAKGEWTWRVSDSPGESDSEARIERWKHWSRGQHERFNWVAGAPLEALGYAATRFPGGRVRWRLYLVFWACLDTVHRLSARLSGHSTMWR